VPDASDAPPPKTCDELFGSAKGYTYCNESTTVCTFAMTTDGSNCKTACESFGATCLAAYDNDDEDCVALPGSADTCETNRGTEICECSRP